ncbi:MAG: TetR/AcrR family transcriptional regulator [Mycobacterium sp.]
MNSGKQLRPGRHQLSRDQVRTHQRDRIFRALETVMAVQGYSETSVADIIKSAGVSRQTFYELFASKEDCFITSYARRQGAVLETLVGISVAKSPMQRFATVLRTYLTVMAADPALSRLYLIGVYAAGPRAIGKRLELQQQFVDAIATVFEARSKQDRFTAQVLVAAISTLVTNAVLEEDPQAVLDLHGPLIRVAERLMASER